MDQKSGIKVNNPSGLFKDDPRKQNGVVFTEKNGEYSKTRFVGDPSLTSADSSFKVILEIS